MTTINKYRLLCTTDSTDEYSWGTTEPTTCPTNTAHTIDASKTTIVDKVEENTVTVNEGGNSLGGWFKVKGEKIIIPTNYVVIGQLVNPVSINDTVFTVDQATIDAIELDDCIRVNDGAAPAMIGYVSIIDDTNNQITVSGSGSPNAYVATDNVELMTTRTDFTQPIDIGVLSLSYISSSDNDGDGLEFQVYPNLTIGVLTSDVIATDTVFDVQQSVIDNVMVGFWVRLDDGNVRECVGLVTAVDEVNNQITVQKPVVNSFLAATPTSVKISVKMLETKDIGPAGPHSPGNDKIGSSLVVKDKNVRVCYHNHTGGAKKFVFNVGYLY